MILIKASTDLNIGQTITVRDNICYPASKEDMPMGCILRDIKEGDVIQYDAIEHTMDIATRKDLNRDMLLEIIAEGAVWAAMRVLNKHQLHRCAICPGKPPEGQLCNQDKPDVDDCSQYGFPPLESIFSATEKIKKILGGRS